MKSFINIFIIKAFIDIIIIKDFDILYIIPRSFSQEIDINTYIKKLINNNLYFI